MRGAVCISGAAGPAVVQRYRPAAVQLLPFGPSFARITGFTSSLRSCGPSSDLTPLTRPE